MAHIAKQPAVRPKPVRQVDFCAECSQPLGVDRSAYRLDDGAVRLFCPEYEVCFSHWWKRLNQ